MSDRGQSLRNIGFGDPAVLLIVGCVAWIFWLMVETSQRAAVEPAQKPNALPGASIAYVPFVFMDAVTGCQYLSTHTSTGLAPRIAADGKTHMGCKGDQ